MPTELLKHTRPRCRLTVVRYGLRPTAEPFSLGNGNGRREVSEGVTSARCRHFLLRKRPHMAEMARTGLWPFCRSPGKPWHTISIGNPWPPFPPQAGYASWRCTRCYIVHCSACHCGACAGTVVPPYMYRCTYIAVRPVRLPFLPHAHAHADWELCCVNVHTCCRVPLSDRDGVVSCARGHQLQVVAVLWPQRCGQVGESQSWKNGPAIPASAALDAYLVCALLQGPTASARAL